jgi:capsular exopolysaccharide synthesis family protein
VNGSSRLTGYTAVLRKHLVLLIVSVVLVLAGGSAYLWRQPAVFEAEALLLIEQPMPNLLGSGAGRNYFAISQAALNTELYLLREDTEMSGAALARAEQLGVDTEAAGYTPEQLAARVTVSHVPGTEGLVRFALTGGDPPTLPRVVLCYAREYSERAVESRSEQFDLTHADLRKRVDVAKSALEASELAREEFAKEHAEHNLERGENAHAQRRAALSGQRPALEDRAVTDGLILRRTIEALSECGISVEYDEQRDAVLTGPAVSAELHAVLADSALVAGLPAVREHPEIARLRGVESDAKKSDRSLAEQGLLDGHERRVAAQRDLDQARERRGWVTARALEIELTEIDARAKHREQVLDDLEAVEEEAATLNRLLGEYQKRSRDVTAKLREFEEARRKLTDFTSLFLTTASADSDGAEASEARLRITVEVEPRAAVQVAPKVPLVIGLTIAAALVTGMGLVFLFEYLDDTIRSKDDFDRYVGLPFLGFVPRISARDHENPDLAAESTPGSAVAEAFRAVRTSILFSRVDRPVRTLLVTSAGPGEGKTTVATNLATTFARKKGPVLLVDADLRKPRVAKALGLGPGPGLSNILVGAATIADVARPTSVEGLFAITSGPIPPNPAELLHGESMVEFLSDAATHYECVVLDTPPLIAVSDARVLASRVDGLYLVISMGNTSRRLIQRAVESLSSIGFDVDGAILNNMSGGDDRYGDYGYYAQDYRAE